MFLVYNSYGAINCLQIEEAFTDKFFHQRTFFHSAGNNKQTEPTGRLFAKNFVSIMCLLLLLCKVLNFPVESIGGSLPLSHCSVFWTWTPVPSTGLSYRRHVQSFDRGRLKPSSHIAYGAEHCFKNLKCINKQTKIIYPLED